ncbi:hypothetical protein [Kribbella pittospori]|uniref:hypothetical protein n=1 Tax=Kribbella pittospori TaxID=722689 RepID=UPI00192D3E82|nr:hypothetical protein [Kribbella pittospori]
MAHVAVQEQDFDQVPGAGGVAVRRPAACHLASWTGVNLPLARARSSAAAQRAGFADQRLQVVVELDSGAALGQ